MRSPSFSLFSACLCLLGCSESAPAEERFGAFRFSQLRAQHCEPEQTGSAYTASSDALTGQAIEAPADSTAPCFGLTGFGAGDSSLAISRDGTVFIAPVFTSDGHGFLRTRDFGVTLEPILPSKRGGAKHTRVKPYLFIEPQTERLLFATAGRPNFEQPAFDLSYSDDLGDTFQSGKVGQGTLDWIKLVSANSITQPGAHVLYASSAAPLSTPVPLTEIKPTHQQIQRSRDNGNSWENVGGNQLSLVPTDHGCKSTEWLIYGAGVATSDGSIFFGLRRCTRLAVAVSSDEGESWQVRELPGATLVDYESLLSRLSRPNLLVSEPLAVDSADNLYAVWSDRDETLRFSVSRDLAQTWSAPVSVSAPSAPSALFPALAVREPGVLALAYYGGDRDSYEAYLAESHDALEPLPTFVSHTVSSRVGPLFKGGFDVGLDLLTSGGDLVEMVQVKYAPNGDIWAAFVKDMCPGHQQGCDWDKQTHANAQFQGAFARLVHR